MRLLICLPLLSLSLLPTLAHAQADSRTLPAVLVHGPVDAAIGAADSASEGAVERASFQNRPKLRPGDIVEAVPGVVATQHSGDGKANQYFLRGFNLDHGTDFAVSVDGMPVNMPSHGHGQGFADLNFLIPDLVSGVQYRKGPYHADSGDFSLAGSATLEYFGVLPRPFLELGVGPDGFRRALLAGSHSREDGTWLGALELEGNDGPWDTPEDLRKVNAALRYSHGTAARGFHVTAMAYRNRWTATDQIPQRAIDSGALSRFGTLDPTDGGRSQRTSLSGKWFDNGPQRQTQISAYAIDYRFDLFSNFTYFLNDPVAGDQFEQVDRRRVFGAQASQGGANTIFGLDGLLTYGAQWRGDRIAAVGLYQTAARRRLATVRDDEVSQDLFSLHAQQLLHFTPRWRGYVGARVDHLHYDVRGREPVFGAANSGQGSDSLVSPKAGLAFTVTPAHELYVNAGRGFHSNDVRGATITIDPASGAPADRVPALVRGTGAEVGWRFQPDERITFTTALWTLRLDSELVYVGDAGATEPGRASTRRGVETTLRWKFSPHWRLEADAAWSRARFRGEAPAGEGNHIDNAVEKVVAAGLSYSSGPWTGSLRLRHMGARALDTLNAVRSRPSTVLNFGGRYEVNRNVTLGLDIFNLTNRKGNDIEYFYASCTAGEVASGACGAGIDDRHVHPMEPRSVRVSARIHF